MAAKYHSLDELLGKTKGQLVELPDLRSAFGGWPGIANDRLNPAFPKLVLDINERLSSVYGYRGVKAVRKLESANFAQFAALWWPVASWSELRILAFLVIWLFTWDDEIDEPGAPCADDFHAAEHYRTETLRYVRQCLGLTDASPVSDSSMSQSPQSYALGFKLDNTQNPIILSFKEIGDALLTSYTWQQRERFFDQIQNFISTIRMEQCIRLDGRIPSPEEYLDLRMDTSAVNISSAMIEYSLRSQLMEPLMDLPLVHDLWRYTNAIISITNDLVSLRKEVKNGCVINVVPLIFGSSDDDCFQSAIDRSVLLLKDFISLFDATADALCLEAGTYTKPVEDFIDVCRSNSVGNLVWSLETQRYGLDSASVIKTTQKGLRFTL